MGNGTVNIEQGTEKQVFFDVMAYDGLGEVTFNLTAKAVAPAPPEEAKIVTNLPFASSRTTCVENRCWSRQGIGASGFHLPIKLH